MKLLLKIRILQVCESRQHYGVSEDYGSGLGHKKQKKTKWLLEYFSFSENAVRYLTMRRARWHDQSLKLQYHSACPKGALFCRQQSLIKVCDNTSTCKQGPRVAICLMECTHSYTGGFSPWHTYTTSQLLLGKIKNHEDMDWLNWLPFQTSLAPYHYLANYTGR